MEKYREQLMVDKVYGNIPKTFIQQIIHKVYNDFIARCIMPIKSMDKQTDLTMPVLHKDFNLTQEDLDSHDITNAVIATRAVIAEENKLCLVGDTPKWRAFGIEGLMTVKGRHCYTPMHDTEEDTIHDLATHAKQLADVRDTNLVFLVNTYYCDRFNKHISPLKETLHNFLLDHKLIDAIYYTDLLTTWNDSHHAMCFILPGEDIAYIAVAQDLKFHWIPDKNLCRVYETLTPVIPMPAGICEIIMA